MNQHSVQNFANSASVTSEISAVLNYAGVAIAPPTIGADVLAGQRAGFLEFLLDDLFEGYRTALFGSERTSVATALQDFRKATKFHYFGYRRTKPGQAPPKNPGLLNAIKAESKKALKEFTQLAYRGDPEKRGPLFWKRVAGVLWDAYEALMALRRKAEKIRQQEIDRIDRIVKKRAARAAYMRRYRARDHQMRIASN